MAFPCKGTFFLGAVAPCVLAVDNSDLSASACQKSHHKGGSWES